MVKIPTRVKNAVNGSISPRDMRNFWKTPSELLGGLSPSEYYEQVGENDLLIAIQNGLAPESISVEEEDD